MTYWTNKRREETCSGQRVLAVTPFTTSYWCGCAVNQKEEQIRMKKPFFFSFFSQYHFIWVWLYAACQRGAERAAVQLVAGGESNAWVMGEDLSATAWRMLKALGVAIAAACDCSLSPDFAADRSCLNVPHVLLVSSVKRGSSLTPAERCRDGTCYRWCGVLSRACCRVLSPVSDTCLVFCSHGNLPLYANNALLLRFPCEK